MKLLIGIIIGAFLAWNLPQPQYAKDIQSWVKERGVKVLLGLSVDEIKENVKKSEPKPQ